MFLYNDLNMSCTDLETNCQIIHIRRILGLYVTENIKICVVKMCTGFVQINIRSRRVFCKLGKEALSSTAGTQIFEIFQNGTDIVVFLA
jgi:hypothetical protein